MFRSVIVIILLGIHPHPTRSRWSLDRGKTVLLSGILPHCLVKILPKTKLILFNSEKDRNLILFGEIKQKLRNNFKEKIKNDKEYSDNNVDKYINMIEFRKIGE